MNGESSKSPNNKSITKKIQQEERRISDISENGAPGPSTYELLFNFFTIMKKNIIRFSKDLILSLVRQWFPQKAPLPRYIEDLCRLHHQHIAEKEPHTVTYIRIIDSLGDLISSLFGLRTVSTSNESREPLQFTKYFKQTIPKATEEEEVIELIEFLHHDDEFLIAAELGDENILQRLIDRRTVNVHAKDHVGRNALHLAVSTGNRHAVRLLLNAGIDPNVKDHVGMSPLSICLMRSPSWRMANLLFDYGAEILPRCNPMDTGLFLQFVMMCKPTREEIRIIRLLVEKGSLVNDPDVPGGRQAMHFAAMSNNLLLMHVLLDLGADLYATNHINETPRQVAAKFRCTAALKLLEEWEDFYTGDRRTLSVPRLI